MILFAIVGALAAGWYVADFMGGLFHYFVDHKASPTCLLTRAVKRDFDEHHVDPLSMEKYSRWPNTILSALGGVPFLFLVMLGFGPGLFGVTVFVGLCVTQLAHYYAHAPNPPRWAKLLQQLGVFISPDGHQKHHGDFTRSYGVFNGWSHGLLDLCLGRRY